MIAPRALRLALGACLLLAMANVTTARAAPAGKTIDVTIQNFQFTPAEISVEKGDTVRWTNLDAASHGPVSIYPGFVTFILIQGQSDSVTLDRPGKYDYVCQVHGVSMRATVIVTGEPVPETPAPPGLEGHVVLDTFDEPFPVATNSSAAAPLAYGAMLLALVAMARFVWVLRKA